MTAVLPDPTAATAAAGRNMSAPLDLGVKSDHRWAALAVLCTAALIINVDNTILNVALPTLVRDLHATSSQLQWIVDSYAMVFAGLLLVCRRPGRPLRAQEVFSPRPGCFRSGVHRRRLLRVQSIS